MTRRWFQFVIVSLAVVAFVCFLSWDVRRLAAPPAPVGTAAKVGFKIGESAPDFELRSLDGRTVQLSTLRGKPVLLNFWATWCAPCRVEMPWLVELDQQYRPQGVQIIGVSLDDPDAEQDVAKFIAQVGVHYTILIGDSSVADTYGGVRFLSHLSVKVPISHGELAAHLAVRPSTLSAAISKLETGLCGTQAGSERSSAGYAEADTKGGYRESGHVRTDPDRVAAILSRLSKKDKMLALAGLEILANASRDFMKRTGKTIRK